MSTTGDNIDLGTLYHKNIRAETRTDPTDGKHYTWNVLSEYYLMRGRSIVDITIYWDGLELHSRGRTRTRNKPLLEENDGRTKKRKLDNARRVK